MLTLEEANKLGMSFCKSCTKLFAIGKASQGVYCSLQCQQDLKATQALEAWKNKELQGWTGQTVQLKPFVRRYMLEKNNYACEVCGWNERHPIDGLPLVEVDHIDGDAEHSWEENLRVLCPNHHAMTPTHRARNKNSKRRRNIDGDVPDL